MAFLEAPRPIRRDPETGIDIVWERRFDESVLFSLVRAAHNQDVVVCYNKPSFNIQIELAPLPRTNSWQLDGIFDADIVQLLDYTVTRPRRGRTPPLLTERDIELLAKDDIVPSPENPGWFESPGTFIDPKRVYSLLNGLWRPKRFEPSNAPPLIHLGDKVHANPYRNWVRVLPQKHPTRVSKYGSATLEVRKEWW